MVENCRGKIISGAYDMCYGYKYYRFAIAVVVVQEADVYMFDEPSSYLDVKQRLKAAAVIRGLVTHQQGMSLYIWICLYYSTHLAIQFIYIHI